MKMLSKKTYIILVSLLAAAQLLAAPFKRSDIQRDSRGAVALEVFSLHSPSMGRGVDVTVMLPPSYDASAAYPVLYTLHGRGAPYQSFTHMSDVTQSMKDRPMIVVAFDAGVASYYIDAPDPVKKSVIFKHPSKLKKITEEEREIKQAEYDAISDEIPSKYKTFFFEELVPATDAWYAIDGERRAITGFSMGGFGALYYALEKPGFFKSVSGMSTAIVNDAFIEERVVGSQKSSLVGVLGRFEGHPERYKDVNIMNRLIGLEDASVFPPQYQVIGTEDFLLPYNREYKEVFEAKGLQLEYVETAGGHTWNFWKHNVQSVVDFHWKHF